MYSLIDRNKNRFIILFTHPNGDYFVRYIDSEQTKWIRGSDSFYSKQYINEGEKEWKSC